MRYFSNELIDALGLTLLDSLWQGALVLLTCGISLWLLRCRSSRIRYYVVFGSLVALSAGSLFTFLCHYDASVTEPAAANLQVAEHLNNSLNFEKEFLPAQSLSLPYSWRHWARSNAYYVSLCWVLGFAVFAFRLVGGFYMVGRLKRVASTLTDDFWRQRLNLFSKQFNISFPVELRQSHKLTSPVVIGFFKPVIIFPIGLLQGMPTDQVEAILLHELAHIKRFDYVINVFVSLLQVIFFYHPAYWWLQGQLDSEREYCCDDLVVNQTGNSLSLIKALTSVREYQLGAPSPSLAFTGQKNQLLKRVERIMKKRTRTNWLGGVISMCLLLLSFFLMSYQAKDKLSNNDKIETAPEDTMKIIRSPYESPAIQEGSVHGGKIKKAYNTDTVTLEQAFIDLLDTDRSGITLVTNEDGRLESLKKKGVLIKEADLKVYQLAYEQLREYVNNEKALREEARAMEVEILEQKRRLYELKAKQEILEEVIVETKKSEAQLVETQDKYEVTVQRLAEEMEKVTEGDVLRKAEAIEDLSEQKIVLDMYRYLIRKLEERTEEINQQSREELERKKTEYHQLIEELKQQGSTTRAKSKVLEIKHLLEELRVIDDIPDGKLEFMESDDAQRLASQSIMALGQSLRIPLIVVDGKIHEDWGFADVNRVDHSRIIRSIDFTPADRSSQKAYKKLMDNRDVLVEVTTAPGGKNYKRPSFVQAKMTVSTNAEIKLRNEEQFSKMLLENILLDKLVEKGWSTMSLSTEAFIINGQKQSDKVHKRYLKMYKKLMGKALLKNQTIEFRE